MSEEKLETNLNERRMIVKKKGIREGKENPYFFLTNSFLPKRCKEQNVRKDDERGRAGVFGILLLAWLGWGGRECGSFRQATRTAKHFRKGVVARNLY